jgi:hypothetical protein
MQFCVWGIEQYDKLDQIYTEIVRKITRNLQGYPAKPIWALAVDGGLGIQSLLDYTHRCKLRLLLKNIGKNDLIVNNVIVDCKCTTANWSKNALKKHQNGFIKISYNAGTRGTFYKTIIVKSNGLTANQSITIKGFVR